MEWTEIGMMGRDGDWGVDYWCQLVTFLIVQPAGTSGRDLPNYTAGPSAHACAG